MRKKDNKPNVALLMPAHVSNYYTLTTAERENIVARARLELLGSHSNSVEMNMRG